MTVILRTLFLVFLIALSTAVRSQDDNTVFTLVRDASELKEGDVLVIVDQDAKVALSNEISTASSILSVGITIDGNNVIINNNDVQIFRMEGSSLGWIFSTGTSYLGGSDKNELSFYDKIDEYTKATINIQNGIAAISFNSKYKLGYNSSGSIFKLYSATIGKIALYKKTSSVPGSLILNGDTQDSDNSDVITSYLNTTVDQVTLQRTFVGDGGWYTLCLPFALTADDIATQFQGADFQKFTGVTMNADNTFNLEFQSVSQTRAGVPYLVRPIKDTEIINPVFTDKLISEAKPVTVVHALQTEPLSEYSFTGIYNSTDLFTVDPSANQTIRFVNADGT